MEYIGYSLDVNGNPIGNANPVSPSVLRFIFSKSLHPITP